MVSGSNGHPCALICRPLCSIVPSGFEVVPPAFVLFAQMVPIFPTYSCAVRCEPWWVEALPCGYGSEVEVTGSLI
jgi:hypothetical protein